MKVKSGEFVAQHVEPVLDEMVQPAGVDLQVGRIYEFDRQDPLILERDGKSLPKRTPVSFDGSRRNSSGEVKEGLAVLYSDFYWLEYRQRVSVPEDCIGLVFPRSSLMRGGAMLNTAVWDPGYVGRGGGLLMASNPVAFEQHARVGQLIFLAAETSGEYDGDYQNEGIEIVSGDD